MSHTPEQRQGPRRLLPNTEATPNARTCRVDPGDFLRAQIQPCNLACISIAITSPGFRRFNPACPLISVHRLLSSIRGFQECLI